MKNSCILKRVFLLVISLLVAVSAMAQSSPKREFRGAWLHIVGNQTIKDMSTSEIQGWFIRTLDSLKTTGCNAVIFQVRPQADAFYESELEPWTRFLTGEQGKAPSPYWDPLAFMIEQCHERGMELHAWLNPYRVTSNDKEVLCPDHLYFKRPDMFLKYGTQLYFDPAEPEARDHTVKVIADIVSRYDVDAIHFDDYFYPYPIAGESFPDDISFAKYAKAQGFSEETRADWRRHNVELLIKDIHDTIRSIKPWVRFGISPFGIHRNIHQDPKGSRTNGLSNYDDLYADVPLWAEKGYIDYITPQLYWKIGFERADYEILINWWNDSNFKGQLYVGQSISTFDAPDLDNPSTTQMAKKMQLVRDLPNVDGNVWWPGWSISKNVVGIADSLATTYQKNIALVPAYTDIDNVAPSPVIKLSRKKKDLKWSVNTTTDPMQQASWFIVYRFSKKEEVNIEDSSKIFSVTKKDSITVPKSKNWKYVVTVADHCWNESIPSMAIQ